MKKLFLTLVVILCVAWSALSQSFIGQNKTYIKSSVLKDNGELISKVSDEFDILTISFTDNHTVLYFLNPNDLCMYYGLCYPIDKYYTMREMINKKFIKTSTEKWYYKDGDYYIFYRIVIDQGGKVFWIFVYPDFYENDMNTIINTL